MKEELIIWEKETKRPGKEKLFADPMARQDREKKQRKKRSPPVDTFCSIVT
jgi:hypothetical protein